MRVDEFDYDLPEELIAQEPARKRDKSRLMCLKKDTGEITEGIFRDIVDYLHPDDLLVLNDSRVIPARLYGEKVPTGTEIEFLLLNEIEDDYWEVLVRPGKRVKKGTRVSFGGGVLTALVEEYTDYGGRKVRFSHEGNFDRVLKKLGEMPLPPYIKKKLEDPSRYQTVYARKEGSAAAPTAGLHFTPELLRKIRACGTEITRITLHVGLGTFRPVKTSRVEEHSMHEEYYEISPEAADKIRKTRAGEGRIVAVGTTVTRTLEAVANKHGRIEPGKGWTDIFIYPGYNFRVIEALITNFHLPRSTLIMMVSAFAGKEKIMKAYRTAIEKSYRFYSLGDAMYIY